MRRLLIVAALFLAACQTQGNDGATVTIDGQTVDAAEAKNRATFKRLFPSTNACEERANEINRRLTRQAVYRGCLCAIPYYADNAPAEVIARHVSEALGTARPLPDDELLSLASKARDATRAAYEACGMRYD
jgi:hypothetical protein